MFATLCAHSSLMAQSGGDQSSHDDRVYHDFSKPLPQGVKGLLVHELVVFLLLSPKHPKPAVTLSRSSVSILLRAALFVDLVLAGAVEITGDGRRAECVPRHCPLHFAPPMLQRAHASLRYLSRSADLRARRRRPSLWRRLKCRFTNKPRRSDPTRPGARPLCVSPREYVDLSPAPSNASVPVYKFLAALNGHKDQRVRLKTVKKNVFRRLKSTWLISDGEWSATGATEIVNARYEIFRIFRGLSETSFGRSPVFIAAAGLIAAKRSLLRAIDKRIHPHTARQNVALSGAAAETGLLGGELMANIACLRAVAWVSSQFNDVTYDDLTFDD